MKRNIFKYILMLTVFAGVFTSCEKKVDTEGMTEKLTYYPLFDFKGDKVVMHAKGAAFTDPGVTASENGVQLPVDVVVSGLYSGYSGDAVQGDVADKYSVTYSAVNAEGFPGSVGRTVYVGTTGDFVTSIEGIYTSTVVRNGSAGEQYTDMAFLMVTKTGANEYSISDAIGAYYDLGRGYGDGYRSAGLTVTANDIAANDFTISSQAEGVGAFGGALETSGFSIDASAKTISFQSNWDAGYLFEVTLTQVSF